MIGTGIAADLHPRNPRIARNKDVVDGEKRPRPQSEGGHLQAEPEAADDMGLRGFSHLFD